uniref:Uncharacterized protein n=1 Tax=Lepeophtheirus salmonis TaxID=72036 RepID=A0A0K2UUF5_LEPSM
MNDFFFFVLLIRPDVSLRGRCYDGSMFNIKIYIIIFL